MVTVRHLKLSLLHRAIQLGILAYIACYAIYWERGYQANSPIYGTVYTKVKGVTRVGDIVYDSSDLVVPATEPGAIFITTRRYTYRQERGECYDDSDNTTNRCKTNADCIDGTTTTNGYVLPNCSSDGYCLIRGWCDVEKDQSRYQQVSFNLNLTEWTVFFRSQVLYTKFNITGQNAEKSKLGYNIFNLSRILHDQDIPKLLETGAIIHVSIDWTCNLDTKTPEAKYYFDRVDPVNTKSSGFNYRAIVLDQNSSSDDGNGIIIYHKRTLTKYYGIRLIVDIKGTGSKFDIFTLVITVGSSVAFFAVATFMTDFVLLYIHPYRNKIKRDKFKQLELRDSAADYPSINSEVIIDGETSHEHLSPRESTGLVHHI